MSESIRYRRWDNVVFKIDFEKNADNDVCTIKLAKREDDCTYETAKDGFSFNDIKFLLDTDSYGKELDYVQLKRKNDSKKYWFSREDFLYRIELECAPQRIPMDAIIISNVNDYMNVIQYYRYIALIARLEALTEAGSSPKTSSSTETDSSTKAGSSKSSNLFQEIQKELANNSSLKKVTYSIITSFNKGALDSAVLKIEEMIKEASGHCEYTKNFSYKQQQILEAIKQSIVLYFRGENFLHYRGVGHIVYPEIPNALRGKNKLYEDQYYRLAKIKHPRELANLSYLDRIAKIQHYGWPSRLLDVTFNPLVALYMACNTIYTTDDPQQKDFGEIIIYFRDELAEKSYDSKSVLIAAALVKLTYQERKALFEFINMHEKYFHYEERNIGIKEDKMQAVLNFCLRIAVARGMETVLSLEEIKQLEVCINDSSISFEDCAHPVDYIYRCIQGQNGRQKIKRHIVGEDQRLRFHCGSQYPSSKEDRYKYVYADELDFNTYKQLFQYVVTAYDKLFVTIRRENMAFQNKIDIFTVLRSYHVRLGMTNDRILAQAGSFIIAGLDDAYINEEMPSSRHDHYARIIVTDKKKIFEELKLLNINDSTMMPDLQHTGEYTKKMFS